MNWTYRTSLSVVALMWMAIACSAQGEKPLLLQKPTLSQTQIVFSYAGDLWTVSRNGGDAVRLTSSVGIETDPHFSPDGKQIAFTGQYDGNTDVFVMPANGGIPKRLTYHPAADEAVGWTPDGKQVLFRSERGYPPHPRLYTVPPTGGFPTEIALPSGVDASYSPNAARLAYVPTWQWQRAWKRYRGGQTTPIWLVDLADAKVEKIPRSNSNDRAPMWIGNKIYFLSDRQGPVSLFAYDLGSKRVSQVLPNNGLDIKSASVGPGAIVYEQFGSIRLYDPITHRDRKVEIHISADMPEVRPHYIDVGTRIDDAGLSPSGARAVFGARGEIFTAPAEKGDIRNLTNTPGVNERDPAWSPDGKWIAYFSDESGEYALHLRPQDRKGEVRKIGLGDPPSFFYHPLWSPDSKKICYSDKRLNLWMVDIAQGTPVKIDTNPKPFFNYSPSWSPDSRWIAYTRQLKSYMGAVFLYSLDTGKSLQVTDGLSDAQFAAFDKGGKYLFFTASTDLGLGMWFADMSSINRPVTRSVYVMVLQKGQPSPLAPESDEEKPTDAVKTDAAKPGAAAGEQVPSVRVDPDRISQRILALPIPARNYTALATGKAGMLFLKEGPPVGFGPESLQRFDLSARKVEKVLDGVGSFVLSANGEKLLYSQGPRWAITAAAGPINPGAGTLNLSGMQVYSDPRIEWRQMYLEAWRGVRDFMYDPNLHGLKIAEMRQRYDPYLDGIASRQDLNYLFDEMLGELTVSHVFNGGGDQPSATRVPVGLLGADYRIENGRYRFARVYDGENWNPELRAPLTQPGVDVAAGEYLLAVNGREVLPTEEVYGYFEATAGKQVTLKVGPNPDGSGAREVVVVPVASEAQLRYLAWIEDNRRKVDKMTGGRLAYVHIPDTSMSGYTSFNRYYFSQVGKEGAIVDERFNGGGQLADFVIDYLKRPLLGYFTQRDGEDFVMPTAAIFGPKAMLINEYAGSGGDFMPWAFRAAKVGTLIGKRTWGGLVGVSGYRLMDGGNVGAPQSGLWNPNSTWDVENHGVAPDIEVEWDPASWRAGHDPQLEKAVEVVLGELKQHPLPKHTRPTFPDYHTKR